MTTFISKYDVLATLIKQCKKQTKDSGLCMVADFAYVDIPNDNFFCGMYTKTEKENTPPQEFEPFKFIIQPEPDHHYDIYHIPPYLVFKAGIEAGFRHIEQVPPYPDPEVENDPAVRRYLDTCNPCDYILKFKWFKL